MDPGPAIAGMKQILDFLRIELDDARNHPVLQQVTVEILPDPFTERAQAVAHLLLIGSITYSRIPTQGLIHQLDSPWADPPLPSARIGRLEGIFPVAVAIAGQCRTRY